MNSFELRAMIEFKNIRDYFLHWQSYKSELGLPGGDIFSNNGDLDLGERVFGGIDDKCFESGLGMSVADFLSLESLRGLDSRLFRPSEESFFLEGLDILIFGDLSMNFQ